MKKKQAAEKQMCIRDSPKPQRLDYRAGRKTEGAACTKGGGGSDTFSQSFDEIYGDTQGRTEGLDEGWTEPGDFTGLKSSQRSLVLSPAKGAFHCEGPVSYTHLEWNDIQISPQNDIRVLAKKEIKIIPYKEDGHYSIYKIKKYDKVDMTGLYSSLPAKRYPFK